MENTSEILRAVSREIDQIANRIDNGQIKPKEKVEFGHIMMSFSKELITQGKLDQTHTGRWNEKENTLNGIDIDVKEFPNNIEEEIDD